MHCSNDTIPGASLPEPRFPYEEDAGTELGSCPVDVMVIALGDDSFVVDRLPDDGRDDSPQIVAYASIPTDNRGASPDPGDGVAYAAWSTRWFEQSGASGRASCPARTLGAPGTLSLGDARLRPARQRRWLFWALLALNLAWLVLPAVQIMTGGMVYGSRALRHISPVFEHLHNAVCIVVLLEVVAWLLASPALSLSALYEAWRVRSPWKALLSLTGLLIWVLLAHSMVIGPHRFRGI